MGNPVAGITDAKRRHPRADPPSRESWSGSTTLAGPLNVSVVRAELIRLRGLRPATKSHAARARHVAAPGER